MQQENLVKQLESILKELKTGEQEASATALRHRAGFTKRLYPKLILLGMLVAAILLAGGFWLLSSPFAKRSESVFVEGIREVSSLATAEAQVMTILEGQDNRLLGQEIPIKLPGTSRKYLIVVPAKILAGVDLQEVTEQDVSIDSKNKKVTITLPKAEVLQEAVQLEAVKVYTNEGFLRGPTTLQEGMGFLGSEEVKEKLRQEAVSAGLLQSSEQQAVSVVQTICKQFDYQAEVKFR